MAPPELSPGPIAERTFDVGFKIAAGGGAVVIAALYWTGVLSISHGVDVVFTLTLFPVYLLVVAVALGLWLGFGPDDSNLTQVVRQADPETEESERKWP